MCGYTPDNGEMIRRVTAQGRRRSPANVVLDFFRGIWRAFRDSFWDE